MNLLGPRTPYVADLPKFFLQNKNKTSGSRCLFLLLALALLLENLLHNLLLLNKECPDNAVLNAVGTS